MVLTAKNTSVKSCHYVTLSPSSDTCPALLANPRRSFQQHDSPGRPYPERGWNAVTSQRFLATIALIFAVPQHPHVLRTYDLWDAGFSYHFSPSSLRRLLLSRSRAGGLPAG